MFRPPIANLVQIVALSLLKLMHVKNGMCNPREGNSVFQIANLIKILLSPCRWSFVQLSLTRDGPWASEMKIG